MFNNIGRKIKGLATVLFFVFAAIAVLAGIIVMTSDRFLVLLGLSIMFVGPLVAWISSWFLYGFGQLIDNSDKLVKCVCNAENEQISDQAAHGAVQNAQAQSQVRQSENAEAVGSSSMPIGKCELCGKSNVPLIDAKIVDDMGTRFRRICSDCYNTHNASPAKK